MSEVKAVPDGYHVVTPYIQVHDAAAAIEFYAQAFGAVERFRMPGPGGKVMHAEIQIGDSVVMLADEFPEQGAPSPQTLGGTAGSLLIYSEDVDVAFQRALEAGGHELQPPTDMFWGDRFSKIKDPFGHQWSIATHIEDVPPEEMGERAAAAMAEMSQG